MAISTACCLTNLPPPPMPNSLSPTKTTQLAAWNRNEGSWRTRCVSGVAGMIMVLEMGNWVAGETAAVEMPRVVDSRSEKIMRWSDERTCPQWRLNSLETIVPENLPRPSARRRWEAIRLPQTAPQLQAASKSIPQSRCFSM